MLLFFIQVGDASVPSRWLCTLPAQPLEAISLSHRLVLS
jgi:hypothetical protein